MKLILVLAVLCCAASVLAKDVKITPQQIAALEAELKKAPLVEELPEFDDGEDTKRLWNPWTWFKNLLKNKCKCEDAKCSCCFKLKFFDNTACLTSETLSDTHQLAINFKMDDKSVVEKKFDLKRDDHVCGSVPGSLSFLKFCFNQQSEVAQDGTFTSCSHIEFKVGSTTGAVIQFKCLEIKGKKVTMGGFKELEKQSMFTLKIKNPFKAALALYKKAKGTNSVAIPSE